MFVFGIVAFTTGAGIGAVLNLIVFLLFTSCWAIGTAFSSCFGGVTAFSDIFIGRTYFVVITGAVSIYLIWVGVFITYYTGFTLSTFWAGTLSVALIYVTGVLYTIGTFSFTNSTKGPSTRNGKISGSSTSTFAFSNYCISYSRNTGRIAGSSKVASSNYSAVIVWFGNISAMFLEGCSSTFLTGVFPSILSYISR